MFGGGSIMIPGMANRISKEITALAPPSTRIKVVAPPEREYGAWIGESIIASWSSLSEVIIFIASSYGLGCSFPWFLSIIYK